MLSLWQSHCQILLGSRDEYITAPDGSSQSTNDYPPSPFTTSLLSPKADTHFTFPRRVEVARVVLRAVVA